LLSLVASLITFVVFMNIAVNINPHTEAQGEFYQYMLQLVFQVANLQQAHTFYLIHEKENDSSQSLPSNIEWLQLKPITSGPMSWKYWYSIKMPLLLRKIKADVVVSINGRASLTTTVPQLLCIRDISFLEQPDLYKQSQSRYFKKNTIKFLQKARFLICFSLFMKEKIISHFKLNPQKVEVVIPQSVLAGLSVSNEEKEKIKLQYADGKEYFLYAGDLDLRHQLLQLLKAFSLFKKRQRSTWKLVLAGTSSDAALVKMLETYKYKEDVVLLTISHLERSTLVAAAYAFITPAYSEGFTLATNDALQAGIAVLAPAESAAGDLLGGAGLLFNPNSPEDMADKMMWVYKNEAGRKELIQKGVAVAEQLADVPSIEQFWNAIMKTAST